MYMYMYVCLFLPSGTQLLGELLDHCRECAQKEATSAYNALQSYFTPPTPSPSRTLYMLEVHGVSSHVYIHVKCIYKYMYIPCTCT